MIEEHTAVSEPVVKAMAEGARATPARITLSRLAAMPGRRATRSDWYLSAWPEKTAPKLAAFSFREIETACACLRPIMHWTCFAEN